MTDRYKYDPKISNWTDMTMTDRYRCDPKNSNWQNKWSIDIGAALTRTKYKLAGRWLIDIGVALKT